MTRIGGARAPAAVAASVFAALYNQGLPSPPIPGETLAFSRACIAAERVRWTYHVTMRLQERRLTGDVLREAAATLEIIEEYPFDKYLPSCRLRGEVPAFIFPLSLRRISRAIIFVW